MQSLWMLFASLGFALMGVCVKLASELYSTAEIVLYRGLVGVFFILCLQRLRGGTLRTALPGAHLWRGLVGVSALWLWFYSFSQLPLATAVTLNYTSPIWIAIILFAGAWWHGKKRIEWGLIGAIALSFVGVTMLLRPAVHAEQWLGGVLALGSGFLAALAYMQVRHLGQLGEPEYRVVFYFSITSLVAGLFGTLLPIGHASALWHPHSSKGIVLLLATGLFATSAQMAMTRAYRFGNMLVNANLQYTGIVFSSLLGILVWNDLLGWLSWAGIVVILTSGLIATYYNSRNAVRAAPAALPETDPIATEA